MSAMFTLLYVIELNVTKVEVVFSGMVPVLFNGTMPA
jgi:hypothetical protein